MIMGMLVLVAGLGALNLGILGFTSKGIPFTKNARVTGGPAKMMGIACLLFSAPVSLLGLLLMVSSAAR